MATIEVDSATGDMWGKIGALLGDEDASGSRRWFASCLAKRDYDSCRRMVPTLTDEQLTSLRAECVADWGPPTN